MTCKSVKDYKYSIASFQSATEISVDNLLKQTKFSLLFLFLLVNVVGFGFFFAFVCLAQCRAQPGQKQT